MKSAGHLLDELIDDAARAMTEVEPSRDLRARVMADLYPPAGNWTRTFAGVGAVAAALLLALWLPAIGRREPVVSQPIGRVEPPQVVSQPNAPTALPVIARRSVSKAQRISAEESAWLARSVPPLAASPAINIDPIQPERSSITPITVEPFGIQPIELAPLDIRTGGGR
jgi:hypothetical protein